MNKNLIQNALLVAPLGVWSLLVGSAEAAHVTSSLTRQQPHTQRQPHTQTIAQAVLPDLATDKSPALVNPAEAADADDATDLSGLDQITAVSQLTDVRPTDWAFQALQSLVERYGCIAGYPDRTFRGNRATTRYEFAAGLNACLDRINDLIQAGTRDLVKKEDLLTVQRLQEEFTAELTALRGQVASLETRTATLETQQFSTTTKLNALAWFNITGAGASDDIRFEAAPGAAVDTRFVGARSGGAPIVRTTRRAEPTVSFLTWLTFDTSFNGRDSLVTQFAAGNGISPANQFASAGFFNSFGVPFTDQTGETVNGSSRIVIHDLFYSFPIGDTIKVTAGPRVNWYRHFDFNRFTLFLTGTSSFDSIGSTQTNTIDRGSGAVVEWTPSKQIRLAVGYLGENTEFLSGVPNLNTSSDPKFGVFGGTNTTTVELTYSPTQNINLRFLYDYSRIQSTIGGQVGGATGEPFPYGYLDAGPGFSEFNPVTGQVSAGGLKFATGHTFSFNFDWLITRGIGIFGRYNYATTNLQPIDKAVNVQSFQVGLAFPDLGKKGALGTLTFLMPMDILKGRQYYASGGGDGGKMYEFEATYFLPINNNLALVPAFYAIFNANNFDSNSTLFVGNLRAQFSF